jgi:hypothetical protein
VPRLNGKLRLPKNARPSSFQTLQCALEHAVSRPQTAFEKTAQPNFAGVAHVLSSNSVGCAIQGCDSVFRTSELISPGARFICKRHSTREQLRAIGRFDRWLPTEAGADDGDETPPGRLLELSEFPEMAEAPLIALNGEGAEGCA